jgi:hypothetical protein
MWEQLSMGNSLSERQRLTSKDGSPLFPPDHHSFRHLLVQHIPIIALVDIIMDYIALSQQHLIALTRNAYGCLDWSPYSIGWISTSLPPRPNDGLITSLTYELKQNITSMATDRNGYRLIYGSCPSGWQSIRMIAIINDRLYLIGTLRVDHVPTVSSNKVAIVSCLVSDVLASALSPTIPIASCHEASSLIKWKLNHASVPEDVFPSSAWVQQMMMETSTIWRRRWVFMALYQIRIEDRDRFPIEPSLDHRPLITCKYYDTTNDKWTHLAHCNGPSGSHKWHGHQSIEVTTIHDRLYLYFPRLESSSVMVYDEMNLRWYELPNINNPKRESMVRLLPTLSLPSLSSSLKPRHHNNRNSNDKTDSSKYMTIVGIETKTTYDMYERYDTINCQLNGPSKWSLPKWIDGSSLPLMINDEWILWPACGAHRNKYWRHGIVRLNDVNDDKKWRWWEATPNGNEYDGSACYIVVTGYDTSAI